MFKTYYQNFQRVAFKLAAFLFLLQLLLVGCWRL